MLSDNNRNEHRKGQGGLEPAGALRTSIRDAREGEKEREREVERNLAYLAYVAYVAYSAYLAHLACLAYLAYSAYLAYLAYLALANLAYLAYLANSASGYLCVLLTNSTRIVHRCLARGTC